MSGFDLHGKTLTAHLIVDNCAKAITFYEKAFGAKDLGHFQMPGSGKIMHAEMQIGLPVGSVQHH